MEDDQVITNGLCRYCGCNEAQAAADARTLGFDEEFASGIYSCCQVVQWADEQWLAWLTAAEQDGKKAENVTLPLEVAEAAREFVHVRSRKPRGL